MLEGHLLSERYRIKGTIGGGGMANVFLAWDTILERDVAIKVLRLEYANDQEFIARFDREAQSATSLAHPNIVNIYDVGEEDHILYMVMEYVDGMTLKEYIQKYGPIEVEEAVDIMKQILAAIEHAHANGLIHRDIKPQNILIDTYGQVKVTDFGIALALSATSLTQTNSIVGSVHYLSPEQARGGMATKKSDIYSLGIVMFELLTGRLPFSGQSPVSIALQHLQHQTPSVRAVNPDVPQSVENIVFRATAKDPAHRFATVREMDDALEMALDPSRLNEELYEVPWDDEEATKAIPIITDDLYNKAAGEETIIHQTNGHQAKAAAPPPGEQDKKDPKRKKRRRKWMIAIALFLLVLMGAATALAYPLLMKPKDVQVPKLENREYENAVEALQQRNLKAERKYIYSEDIEEGNVVRSDPKSGRTVKEQSIVTLFVSQGKERKKTKDYTGSKYEEAEKELLDLGYKDVIFYEKFSDQAAGEIIRQIQPTPDSEVIPSETTVIFEVSSGPETTSLTNLKGMTEDEAESYLNNHDLKIEVHKEHSEVVPEGEIIRQDPAADTQLSKGNIVKVYLSKGPEKKKPSEKEVSFTIPYAPETDEDSEVNPPEQVVEIYIGDMKHKIRDLYKKETIKEDTEFKIKLKIEPGTSAEYKVLRDGQLIMDKNVAYEDGE